LVAATRSDRWPTTGVPRNRCSRGREDTGRLSFCQSGARLPPTAEAGGFPPRDSMIPPAACLLRIYVNADDRWHHKPLYQAVVEKARAMDAAGASVFGVDLSYGANHQLRDA